MTGNGGPPVQGISLSELKPDPCSCGHNEWTIDRYVVMTQHRFRPDIKARVVKERDICRKCGAVRDMT